MGGSLPPARLSIRGRKKLEALEPAIGYRVTLRLKDERAIAATRAERRAAVCIMIRQGRARRLLACAVAERHAEAIVLCSRAEAGAYAGRTATALSLSLRLEVAFEVARIKPICDQQQLANAFEQVLQQGEPRQLTDEDFYDGTNLPDLIGMRVHGDYGRALLRAYLPSVSEQALLDRLKVDLSEPVSFDETVLVEAMLAAAGRSSLKGRSRASVGARRAAASVARLHMTAPAFANLLGIDVRTAFRMRAQHCDKALARAIELQLRWRSLLRRTPA